MSEANVTPGNDDKSKLNNSSNLAAVVIGLYLIIHIVLLVRIALGAWFTSDCSYWWPFPFRKLWLLNLPCPEGLSPEKLADFQRLVISGCMAGLGGAVYSVRKFYVTYAYGYDKKDGTREYLRRREIARYLLLPFSSVVLGPVTMALAKAGALAFTGSAAGKQMPILTLVGFSFAAGFSYHDTLKALGNLFAPKDNDKASKKQKDKDKSSTEENQQPPSGDSAKGKGAGA